MPIFDAFIINTYLNATLVEGGIFAFDCETLPTLPDLQLTFGEVEVNLPSSAYSITLQDPESNEKLCISAISISAAPLWIVGDAFLREYYTVYDKKENRVGFAKSVQE